GGALLFAASAAVFGLIAEQPGATEGGGNALQAALASIGLLRTDPLFRRFVLVRISMLTVALAPPFYVLLIQQRGGGLGDLGLLIIASGLASSLSAPIWGRLSDRSSRLVMVLSAAAAGIVGVITWALAAADSILLDGAYTFAVLFLLLGIAHAGVRLGRKVYLVDMATAGTRAAMVAVSNTVIGVAMLAGGAIGVLADVYDAATVVLVLGVGALGSALYAMMLKEVSEPE
ncbi:MAG: MFS transporter, partial [Thiohalocapsa sp.]|nr:MFS transporter [Thiohalocapsa sp.]